MTSLLQTKNPKGFALLFLGGGGSTHYFANANSHANCRFCFFGGGEGALPITSQMPIPMQIVVSPLGHFGRSPCIHTHQGKHNTKKWQVVSRTWSTSNTGTHQEEPHPRITADLDLGGQGTSSVSNSIICFHGPPSLQCHTNRHLHRTRPALKGLAGKKKTPVKTGNGIVGKAGQHVHKPRGGRERPVLVACFRGLVWWPVLAAFLGGLFWRLY